MAKLLVFLAFAAIVLQDGEAKELRPRSGIPPVTEEDMGSVEDYDIQEPVTPIHNSDKWKQLSPEDRRRLAVESYYTIIGLCERKDIAHCEPSDVKFIARNMARGDPDCFFYCGFDKMKKNANRLPGQYTLALSLDIGLDWNDVVQDSSDIEDLDKKGRSAAGASRENRKRIGFFALAIIGVFINIGSAAAIGYFSNDRNLDEMGTVGGKSGALRAAIGPAIKVAKVSRGCFDIKGVVNIKDMNGNLFSKKVGDLKIGDEVESVDDDGKLVFSKIYYIAHGDGKKRAKLLRVYYEEDGGMLGSIGLSERHLIYSTKQGTGIADAVNAKPVMASKLVKGDFVWVHQGDKLVAKKVTETLPYVGNVVHPLTDNHHIIVNGVHASVHILDEDTYRMMTTPLRWVCWLNPEAAKSKLVNKLVRFVEGAKEPFANEAIGSVFEGREAHMGAYGMSQA